LYFVARQVVVVDDLDGTVGARTVTFSLDGTLYTIDLAEHNIARLRAELAPFIEAGRLSTKRVKRPDRRLNRLIRAWAVEQGIELSPMGRIPNSVVRQYHQETGQR
jgi:hypothetical protein